HPITATTLSTGDDLKKNLAEIRTLGYAMSWGEREEGILSIAVPIFNRKGEILFSFSLAGPASRFTEDTAKSLIPQIQRMCREISQQIG
ncbi:MAG TPA: IclR family transcriptional regulator C-terminal domain-containing protein, partial [Aminivibrio sp.]